MLWPGAFVLLLILINLIVYFYYKNQQNTFFNYIKNRDFTQIKNIETSIDTYSKISSKFIYRKSNVIFLEERIFLITPNKPIIEISNCIKKFPAVYYHFNYSSKTLKNNTLEIKGNTSLGKVNIFLNFNNFDLHSINEYL
ncbi:hypothetical protein SAMN05444407_105186 [Chryseobacterium contaminans]|uniref:Uncharacterized protein n=1 Tax=Chryseobacterium contaminans TaxID=1423959 RepID=A0A1M7CE51_9FLAO|nr:hypothetical protein SAMN05444407_105186 [Chryseobacterium contaminans]